MILKHAVFLIIAIFLMIFIVLKWIAKKASRMLQSSPSKAKKSPSSLALTPTGHLNILMNSARIGNTESILQLYKKKRDLTLQDKDGKAALHEAAKNGHQETCRLLVLLSFPTEIEKVRNSLGETALDLAEDPNVHHDLKLLEHGLGERKEDLHSLTNDRLVDKNADNWPKSAKLALSMDGGGVRVLVVPGIIGLQLKTKTIYTQTLLHLDKLTGGTLANKIDWMAGTSSGGISPLLIGTGRSIEDCRHFILSGIRKVFCGNKSAIPKHTDAGILEIGKTEWGDKRMNCIRNQKVFVTVCDTSSSPSQLVLFRSYKPNVSEKICQENGYLDPGRILLWKAVRYTAAAPYFFESFNGLSDGGILANNPTQTLISEFLQFNSMQKEEANRQDLPFEEEHLGCVLSLGTGVPPTHKTDGIDFDVQFLNQLNPWSLARGLMNVMNTAITAGTLLLKEITSSNGQPFIHSRAWSHSLGVPFFRFSPHLKEDYAMDDTSTPKLIEIMWDTEIYLRGEARKDMEQFARLIATKPENQYNKTPRGSPNKRANSPY